MTTLQLASTDARSTEADAVVIGVGKGPDGPQPAPGAAALDAALGGRLAATLAALGATGKEGEAVRFASLDGTAAATVVAVGLGPVPAAGASYRPETLRRAAGTATRTLHGTGVASVATTLAQANGPADEHTVAAVAEGLLLGAYRFDRFRSPEHTAPPLASATVLVEGRQPRDKALKGAIARAEAVCAAVARCRDLVNTPPGHLHPKELAEAAVQVAKAHDLSVEVLDEKALRKGGYGGILGVGQGSANPPRLVRLAYTPAKAKRTLALVGKGITFDSGGLSIKPAQAMEWMKSDMGGAAAVIATVQAVAALGLPVNVVGWVPTAENMPGGSAIRPSDVLTMYGGKTVEVLNTDAEGRLIMADALVRACGEQPDLLVDVATLTGAQLVALGARTAAVMGNDEALRSAIVAAADRSGELVWPMPLPEELRPSLDSPVADISNMGERYGGMLVAGLFLREFVAEGQRWAHLDVAGPAYNQGDPWGYTHRGGTGAPVRTLVELAAGLAQAAL